MSPKRGPRARLRRSLERYLGVPFSLRSLNAQRKIVSIEHE